MTVAICTRDRPELLGRALASVLAQRPQAQDVLVIDNAPSSNATRDAVARSPGPIRYVSETAAGLNFARNRALAQARHDVVAFLDDDAVACEDWAQHLWQTFEQNPGVTLCTGHTAPLSVHTEAERLFESNGGYGRGDTEIRLPGDADRWLHGLPAPLIAWAVSVGNGTNFAVRRSSLKSVGGFDEAFELAGVLHGGGDLDLFWRVLAAGKELIYQPAARVKHQHRQSVPAMGGQLAAHQRAVVAFLVKSVGDAPCFAARLPIACFLMWRLIKPITRMTKRCFGLDPLPMPILWEMTLGCVAGLTAYPQAQRIAHQRRLEYPMVAR